MLRAESVGLGRESKKYCQRSGEYRDHRLFWQLPPDRHVQTRIAYGFAKQCLGLVRYGGRVVGRIIRIHEIHLDPEFGENIIELGVGPSVQVVRGYDFIPFLGDVDNGVKTPLVPDASPKAAAPPSKAVTRCSRRRWSDSSGVCKCFQALASQTSWPHARYR